MDAGRTALTISVVSLVPAVYGTVMPTMADTRGQEDDRGHLQAGEKYAALVSAAVVVAVAGVTRSPEAMLAGLVAVVGMAAAYRFAVQATP